MNHYQLVSWLEELKACKEAIEWVKNNPKAPNELWNNCPRGDWMLWLASKAKVDKKQMVLSACDCAELVLHLIPAYRNSKCRDTIQTARNWCVGKATADDCRRAAYAVYAAGAADAADAAGNAARAAAYAAYAVYAADAAADAAAAAGAAGNAANAVRTKMHRKCAIKIAKHISWTDILNAKDV